MTETVFLTFCDQYVVKVLPTENKIKHPQAFRNVFLVSTAITIGINVATATLGYMCFGDKTKAMLTLNLPSSGSGSW